MCGIAGVIGEERVTDVEKMLNLIFHRGQDSSQLQNFDRLGSIGINRLSIIDVERGHQPLFNEDGTVAVVCNGEVYNHQSIRADLGKDHDFRTKSDAEVIVHLYEEYGDDAIKLMDGMFAFILQGYRRGRQESNK